MNLRSIISYTAAAPFLLALAEAANSPVTAVDIGSRRELFVDNALVDQLKGKAELRLHRPVPREISLVHDALWEGSGTGYHSVFQDGDKYRMYYKAYEISPLHEAESKKNQEVHPLFCAYAESDDGIHWRKPELALYQFNGTKANYIVRVSGVIG